MKIRSIRFANLNSLYGQWEIDFSHNAYVRDGLFAITGPTGSGKSTILDAICLALYGRTPRLDSIGSQANEIMSRQEGSCFSEVTFETATGVFRCLWGQHRARKRPEGKLAESIHEFSDVLAKKVLHTKKREVAKAVEEATGMTFERFTRSMMLAQGQFSAFLNAEADQRSPILEQITGTEIYSDISMRVHVATARRRGAVELLERESQEAKPLDDRMLFALQEQQRVQRLWLDTLHRRLQALATARSTLIMLQTNEELLASVEESLRKVSQDDQAIEKIRQRLAQAERALNLEPSFTALQHRREDLARKREALSGYEGTLPEALEKLSSSERARQEASRHVSEARSEMQAMLKVLSEVRSIDRRIADSQGDADLVRRQLFDALMLKRAASDAVKGAASTLDAQQTVVDEAQGWMSEHRADESLEDALAELRAKVGDLVTKEQARQNLATRRRGVDARLGGTVGHLGLTRGQQDSLALERQKILDELDELSRSVEDLLGGKLIREYEAERDHLQEKRALLAAISSLEEHRERLEEGKPCPLCGSTDHPYRIGTLPSDDGIANRLDHIARILGEHDNLSSRKESIRERFGEIEKRLVHQSTRIDALRAQQGELEAELSALKLEDAAIACEFERMQSDIETAMRLWSPQEGRAQSRLDELERRARIWRERKEKSEQARKRRDVLRHALERQLDGLSHAAKAVDASRARLASLRRNIDEDHRRRSDLFGEQDADELELARSEGVSSAEQALVVASDMNRQATRAADQIQSAATSVRDQITRDSLQLETEELRFTEALGAALFADEQAFLDAHLDQRDREQSAAAVADHVRKGDLLRGQEAQARAERKRLSGETPTGWTLVAVQEEISLFEKEVREIHHRLGAIEQRLESDELQRERYARQLAQIAEQERLLRRWERLNHLIGSHDGKKYRNYAQHLTFELLIAHANEHLAELSDRYVLAPDPAKALEFSVMDLYQAGEIRSARNLSGGESFLVSLSLSLGLSSIASKRVQVDSLFLDEGFGTLDEQALESALCALSSLRSKGKLVGIISHVGMLQERIPVQIRVTPLSGGMSRIDGPGCSHPVLPIP